jgi:hypothetical protein
MLERICTLHSGSRPSIPILHHFAFERANDGRIHITGHKGPAASSTKALDSRHELIPQRTEELAEPALIIPEEMYPTKRFPTPEDTYSPSPPRGPSPVPRSPRSEVSEVLLAKPRMEFVYPPKPRPRARQPGDAEAEREDENTREFSPGPPWLDKMLVDLEHGRKDLVGDLEEVKREARDALYDVTRLQIFVKREQGKTKALMDWLRGVVGDEVVEKMITEATQAADEVSDDEDVAEEGEVRERDEVNDNNNDEDGGGDGESDGDGDGESDGDSDEDGDSEENSDSNGDSDEDGDSEENSDSNGNGNNDKGDEHIIDDDGQM